MSPWVACGLTVSLILAASVLAVPARRMGLPVTPMAIPAGVLAVIALAATYRRRGVALARLVVPVVAAGVAAISLLATVDLPVERLHVVMFGALGFTLARAACAHAPGVAGWAATASLAVAIAVLDELLQGFLPGRFYDPGDVGLNVASAAVGAALALPVVGGNPAAPRAAGGVLRAATLAGVAALGAMTLLARASFDPALAVGTWNGVNACGTSETTVLGPDGRLGWRDEQGNRAEGEWWITSNAFEEIVIHLRVDRARNEGESRCGLRVEPGYYADPFEWGGDHFFLGANRRERRDRVGGVGDVG